MTTPTIRTRESDEPARSSGEASCGICRRQVSRYTCPSCNLFYCSLRCFRSEAHSRCSETFYRKEIEIGIKSGTSETADDRNKMIELLKRVEEQSAANEDGLFHDPNQETEEDSLVHRFSAIDISSASADDLLRLLTKKQRAEFLSALNDPSSGLVQELLQSEDVRKTEQLPWWEAPGVCNQVPFQSPLNSPRGRHGVQPDLMAVPTSLISHTSRGVSLLYTVCAVLLAYSYVTRHLSMSPLASTTNDSQDQDEARRILLQALPFLMDRKSRLCHMSLTDAVLSFWSRLDPGSIDNRAMLILLQDVAKFVRPQRITVSEDSSSEREQTVALAMDHPFATTIMAISDISSLFCNHVGSSAVSSRRSSVVMKLTFYAAHILSTPSSRLHALADEVNSFSKSIAKEDH